MRLPIPPEFENCINCGSTSVKASAIRLAILQDEKTQKARSQNADDSVRVNCELDSNETDESDLQNEKHSELRI
jgi:hypothetical protein